MNTTFLVPDAARVRLCVPVIAMLLSMLAGCKDSPVEDDGGNVASSIRIGVPAMPLIGDTIRVTAIATNRGGRELPEVQPAVTVTVRGTAVRRIGDGVFLAADTGRFIVEAATGAIRSEQSASIGMPASLQITVAAPDSVNVGDSAVTTVVAVRRDGVLRSDLAARLVSSDAGIVQVISEANRIALRPLAAGTVTLTAQLGTQVVTRLVRVRPARILTFAFLPAPAVLDVGDKTALNVSAFDVLGQFVPADEFSFRVINGPGVLDGPTDVRATAPGLIVLEASVRGQTRVDTVDVMPPSQFTITLRPGVSSDGTVSAIPPKLQRAMERAVKRWRQVIREDLPLAPLKLPANTCRNPAIDESVRGVLVHVRAPSLGLTGILGQATACVLRPDGRTIQGFMEFNADVLDRLGDNELFFVAAHELGHVLGIGTIWYRNDGLPALVSRSGSTNLFIGAQALAQFDLLENRATYTGPAIPLAADRGHWDSRVLMQELMEPFQRPTTRFSRLTVGAMADMGYVVNSRSWDRYAIPLPGFSSTAAPWLLDLTGDMQPPFGVAQPDGRVLPLR